MAKEVTTISPEGLEVANSYLQFKTFGSLRPTTGRGEKGSRYTK